METPPPEDIPQYILDSKKRIDGFIKYDKYQQAFIALLLVLGTLNDETEKNEIIEYYTEKMFRETSNI